MSAIDGILFVGFLAYVIWDGARRSKSAGDSDSYFLAGRTLPWWAMTLSIMATQASAITMIGTTGKGMREGMRFVQFYYALPIAMVILAFTLVPLFHRAGVTTAYEYLGQRFDRKTRLLSALVFLVQRALALGIVIFAPSVVLASIFPVSVEIIVIAMGALAVLYTALGGLGAVVATDVKQMTVMAVGLVVAFVTILWRLPEDIGLSESLALAAETGRTVVADMRFDPGEKFTIPSSLLGGLFLFLAYFGCDQSQVQRYLAGRSLKEKQGALLLNGLLKVPFQFLVLACGVLLFSFYLFQTPPVTFIESERTMLEERAPTELAELEAEHRLSWDHAAERGRIYLAERSELNGIMFDGAVKAAEARRGDYERLARSHGIEPDNDINYAFPRFILEFLPMGVVGLLLAAILAAALSSIDSELNSLSTVAVVDLYRFGLGRDPDPKHTVRIGRLCTIVFGALATAFALYAVELQDVIEAVNNVGSYFYGSLLGVFVLAVAYPRASGTGACAGLIAGIAAAAVGGFYFELAFLYLNGVSTLACLVVGAVVSEFPE